jgi:hypothetical protein
LNSCSNSGSAFNSIPSFKINKHERNFTISCSGRENTMLMRSYCIPSRFSLNIARVNATSNTITSCGSSFFIHRRNILNFQYCFIKNNSRYNCTALSNVYSIHSVRCIVFHSNICSYFDGLRRGMFAVDGIWTIQDSIFSNNVVSYLVGDWMSHAGRLKFVRCSFDNPSFTGAIGRIER